VFATIPKEVLPDVYLIEVPLPENPLRNLNSYFIRGKDRNLLIDTGFNREECYEALAGALAELGEDRDRTDLFITHMHSDHSGLASRIAGGASKIYMGEKDCVYFRQVLSAEGWRDIDGFLFSLGFSEEEIRQNHLTNPIRKYAPAWDTLWTPVADGFSLDVGRYRLRAVETPGHTPGHMCLYEEKQKLLFCGDHVIFDISPNIVSWKDERLPLRLYMESLALIRTFEVKTALSAHRRAIGDFEKRIDELLRHHRVRLEEAQNLVEAYPRSTVYAIAAKMTWVSRTGWPGFSVAQKWFAVGEAAAHLDYLAAEGKITREMEGEHFVFFSSAGKNEKQR
jgi:glyoxylase-like metal-dependent hydrolase (beta-lactamase superfamily II)